MQGLGGALLSPAALSLGTTLFSEGAERNKALGVWGAVAGSGGAVGVLAGGVLTEYFGWEWVLFVNTPIGSRGPPAGDAPAASPKQEGERHNDFAGSHLGDVGLTLLRLRDVEAPDGRGAPADLGLIGSRWRFRPRFASIGCRGRAPVRAVRHLRPTDRTGANVDGLCCSHVAGSRCSSSFAATCSRCWLSGRLKAGLAYLPLRARSSSRPGVPRRQLVTMVGFKNVLASGWARVRRARRVLAGRRRTAPTSATSCSRRWSRRSGSGFAFVPVTIAAVTDVQPARGRPRFGLVNTAQQIGGAVGLAILATVATSRTDDVMGRRRRAIAQQLPVALTRASSTRSSSAPACAIVGAMLAAVLISSRASREHAEAARRGDAAVMPAAA
jgi:MFS family permease